MNLRTNTQEYEPDNKIRYWYFFNYAYVTSSNMIGEGVVELSYIRRKITHMSQLLEIADSILTENNENEKNEKWKNVLIRNYIFLRKGEKNGIKSRKEKTSTENDT